MFFFYSKKLQLNLKIHRLTEKLNIKNPVLTVGTFDGVHSGHQKILTKLIECAKKINGESVVFTLFPHPRKVLFQDDNLQFLNTIDEKIQLLEKIGIDRFIIYPFTKEFAKFTSCNFIEKILHNNLNIKKLIVGYDHSFGNDKQSDFQILKNCSKRFNIGIEKVEALKKSKQNVSSTKIRNFLLEKELEKANSFLGYEYFISGKVVSGNKIGRTIGFPTANILPDSNRLIPASGVYAVEIIISKKKYLGMLNVGSRPTVTTNNDKIIEVHILNFGDDIYQKRIKIVFKKYIREEKKFPDINALKQQLIKDKINIQSLNHTH